MGDAAAADGAEYDFSPVEGDGDGGFGGDDGEGGRNDDALRSTGGSLPVGRTARGAIGNAAEEDVVLSIPAFANDENKALNARLIARNRELARVSSETLEHQERIAVMQEHLNNVRLELVNAQKVLAARNKEVKTEDDLRSLAMRAVGRMRSEMGALDARAAAVEGSLGTTQAAVLKSTEKLDAFRSAMNWKAEEMERWAAAARVKEEDALALDAYTRGDEAKVRELTRELERLGGAVVLKRKELESEAVESAAKQVELDKLADDFKAAHADRAAMLGRWQDQLAAVKRRDEEIGRLTERFADMRATVAARRQRIRDAETLLARLQAEVEETERTIEDVHRRVAATRDALTSWTTRTRDVKERVDVIAFEVQGAAGELVNKRSEIENAGAAIAEAAAATVRAAEALAATKMRKADVAASAAAQEEALSKREVFLAREAARLEKAGADVAKLQEARYRAEDTVAKLGEQEKHLAGEITGCKRARRALEGRMAELDALSTRQAEHVYEAEFQIQQMEKKVRR